MTDFFKKHRGFTLVEALISIGLIGIIMVSMVGLFSNALQNNSHSKKLMQTTVLAKDIMENVKEEFKSLPLDSPDIGILTNIAKEIQKQYLETSIAISQKGILPPQEHLFVIKVQVPGVKEGSVETFVSNIYLP